MRIGFDARILTLPRCGGVTVFLRLLEHLPLLDDQLELVLFFPRPFLPEYQRYLKHDRIVCVQVAERVSDISRWPNRQLSPLLREQRIDIFHQPFNADGPFFCAPCPVVVTIHDLIPWVIPGIFRKAVKALRYKVRNILWAHAAARVHTVSETSKFDIMRLCRVPATKVLVTHLGADDIYSCAIAPGEEQEILQRYSLVGKRYVVNMGGLNQLRRNPDFIIEGFARYLDRTGDDSFLVITGQVLKQDGFFDRVKAKMVKEGINDRVILTGFLSNKELKVVLSHGLVSVVTSLYEGFCLPLTESFSCGIPTIANHAGSIPEIAGDAAILVDPRKPDELAGHLQLLMQDENRRAVLSRQGRERVKQFRWDEMARGVLAMYHSVGRSRA